MDGVAMTAFWERVDRSGGQDACWIWLGCVGANGYGRWGVGILAHRTAYELAIGPIPKGLHIDHLCRNRPCVNPRHLEAVTQTENNRRTRRPQCGYGHAWTPENIYVRPGTEKRECRACRRRYQEALRARGYQREWRARKKAEAA